MKEFIDLQQVNKGDKVAILSPSGSVSGIFPQVHDLGIKRIKEDFGLHPVEYKTTRINGASLIQRANDVNQAFSDRSIKAIITTIGGSDQIKLLSHLDKKVIMNNPKPFFGYSDNTHIANYLWKLGIPSYYGGGVMTQYAMQGRMDPFTVEYLNWALFDPSSSIEVKSSDEYNEIGLDWSDENLLDTVREYEKNDGIYWSGKGKVKGILWGGCVESLVALFSSGSKYSPSDEEIENCVLILETAEDIPEHWIIEYLLTGLGERGWFNRINAVIVGRPKTWEFDKTNSRVVRNKYKREQREVVIKTVRHYNSQLPVIQNLDFGHTDPQIPMPLGRQVSIDCDEKSILINKI